MNLDHLTLNRWDALQALHYLCKSNMPVALYGDETIHTVFVRKLEKMNNCSITMLKARRFNTREFQNELFELMDKRTFFIISVDKDSERQMISGLNNRLSHIQVE